MNLQTDDKKRLAEALLDALQAADPGAFIQANDENDLEYVCIDGHFNLLKVMDAVSKKMKAPRSCE